MNIFNRFEHHDAVIFLPIDDPLYSEQASRLVADLACITSSLSTPPAFSQYFSGVTHDSHGSFVAIFDDAVLTLDSAQQEQISDSLMSAFESTAWYENWVTANAIRDQSLGLEQAKKSPAIIATYIDSRIACGYKVSRDELIDTFSGHFSEEEIDQASLIARVKHPDSFSG